MLVPGADDAPRRARRRARRCASCRPPCPATRSRSGAAAWPPTRSTCTAAANEALLAANVAEGDAERAGARLRGDRRLPAAAAAMSEDPAELQRFYAETVEPLVAYDEQYETDLVRRSRRSSTPTATSRAPPQRLFTHRHTIRYRLERVRELTGPRRRLDRRAREARLGLKAMRVLGIAHRGGPGARGRRRGGPGAAPLVAPACDFQSGHAPTFDRAHRRFGHGTASPDSGLRERAKKALQRGADPPISVPWTWVGPPSGDAPGGQRCSGSSSPWGSSAAA